jgi:hypothetical protein
MLRRKPTSIKLTPDDMAIYDDFRKDLEARKAKEAQANAAAGVGAGAKGGAGSSLDPKVRQRAREERMGVGSRGGG